MIKKIISSFILIFLLATPICLSIWFLWTDNDFHVETELKDEILHFSVDIFSENPLKSSFQRIIGSSFDLSHYNFCIKNNFSIDDNIDALFVGIEFTGKYKGYPKLEISNQNEKCIDLRIDDIITYKIILEQCLAETIEMTNPKIDKEAGDLHVEEVYISYKSVHPKRDTDYEVITLDDIPENAETFKVETDCSDESMRVIIELGPDINNLQVTAELNLGDKIASILIIFFAFWGSCFLLKEVGLYSKKLIKIIFTKK